MARLLIIDDEANVCYSLEKALGSDHLEVASAGTAQEGIEIVRRQPPDVIILDVRLPDMSGLEAYARLREMDPRLPVIVITAHGTTETAIEAMKLGAFEYLLKPVDLHHLREVVGRAVQLSRMVHVPTVFGESLPAEGGGDRLLGHSPLMQEVYKAIGRVAPQDVTVLIRGESGTGKELVARAIYQHSRRAAAIFQAINCAAIPDTLLESELFGHERGSFTGADRRRIGKFEQATGGTIFMDEVGDMAAATQAKLLRLLQEQRFERVGGNTAVQTDVRVIAATNQDLEALVAAGRFRQDLFYRLNVFTVNLPPLRDRREDLPLLVEHFLGQFNRELGRRVRALAPDALRILEQHSWPGNVRELQSTVKYALVHATGELLTADCLPASIRQPELKPSPPAAGGESLDVAGLVRRLLASGQADLYYCVQTAVDHVVLDEVLRYVKGNQVAAANLLGISRNTLRAKLRGLGLSVEKQLIPEADQEV